MRQFQFGLAIVVVLSATQSGFSQSGNNPDYSRDEVINSLVEQVDLGRTRAVCIGTKTECEASKQQVKGFDMMLTFDLDSATLSEAAKKNLDVVVEALSDGRLKAAKFRVEGHTDARGSDGYNVSLSTQRADAVVRYLEAKNVAADKLEAIGLGKSMPRTSNPYDAENRRVELKLSTQ